MSRTAKLSFFEDRIEAVPLTNGGMAYIQRPNAEAVLQARADDSEDAEKSCTCTYRVSVGPMEVSKLKLAWRASHPFCTNFHTHDLLNLFT